MTRCCVHCYKPLVSIGTARKNGVHTHNDWGARLYHKKCMKYNKALDMNIELDDDDDELPQYIIDIDKKIRTYEWIVANTELTNYPTFDEWLHTDRLYLH